MSTELIPCPFCGKQPRIGMIEENDESNSPDEMHLVLYNAENVAREDSELLLICSCGIETRLFANGPEALAFWNTRSHDPYPARLPALQAAHHRHDVQKPCVWKEYEPGKWDTACGDSFLFASGG